MEAGGGKYLNFIKIVLKKYNGKTENTQNFTPYNSAMLMS